MRGDVFTRKSQCKLFVVSVDLKGEINEKIFQTTITGNNVYTSFIY
jgi:hypothetical protein